MENVENVVLIIHLILALCLIAIVLLQRSEGGMGGLGGGGGFVSARGAATALGKLTWGFAAAFIVTSMALTIISAQKSSTASVLDRISEQPAEQTLPAVPSADELLPPGTTDAPLIPRAD